MTTSSNHGALTRRLITSPAELDRLVGEQIAVSPWLHIGQERIDRFALATSDDQWIHVDPARAAHGPYGRTIAHGYLTLSLLPWLLAQAVELQGARLSVNYGLNNARFPAPVPVDSRIRVRVRLLAVQALPDFEGVPGRQITWQLMAEREGSAKPVCVAETISRRHWGPPSAGTA